MLSKLNMWNKVGRIIALLSDRLNVDVAKATDIFYRSRTCKELHDESTGLYLMGDRYVLDNLITELWQQQ